MKPISLKSLVPASWLFAALATGCGEKPSFQEDQSVRTRQSGDSTQQVDEYGNPIKTGAKGPGAGSAGDAAGGEGGQGGMDTTDDVEPANEGSGSGDGDGNGNGNGIGNGGHTGDDGTGGMDAGHDGPVDAKGGKGGHTGDDGDTPDPDGNDTTNPRKKMTTEMSFPSHTLMGAQATQNLDGAYLTQEITLQRQYVDKAKQAKQIVRPVLTDNWDQGYTGSTATENFNQVANRPLDILVLVDNSGSMAEEQQNLATKLLPLLSYVQTSDWVIGVATTDPNQTCLRKLIKKGDADAMDAFAAAVTAGTAGSNNERHLLQAVRSLSGQCLTAPWIRSNSTLAVLMVTDEDNCSDGRDCPGKDYTNASYLVNYLKTIREVGKNARVYGILWHASQTQEQCPTAMNKANILSDVIAQTSGTWGSICDADYTETLSAVSKDIMVVLNSKFTLAQTPDPGSVRVFVNGAEIGSGFTVQGRVVEILPAPADGSVVTISYRYGSQPIKTSFNLRAKPLNGQAYVTVNGVAAAPGTYTIDAAAQTLTFAQAPAERAKIAAAYTQDVALNQSFALADAVKAGTLKVWVNGTPTTAYTVNEATGVVTFTAPPAEGATVDFAYTAVGNAIVVYPFTVPYGTPKDLVAYDSVTGAPLTVAYLSGTVTILTGWTEGRRVTLRYDNLARQKFSVMLPNTPIPGSVTAVGCKYPQNVVVTGNTVNVDGCDFPDDLATVTVLYQYVVAAYTEFTFASDKLPAANAWQEWRVYVNGAETTAYTRAGNVIKVTAPLAPVSTVKVVLIQEAK